MPLISGFTLIRAVSLCHLTAAYFFLTAPRAIADHNVVFMLGEAVKMPHVTTMDRPNEASAFIAIILTVLGISDFAASSMEEEAAIHYWLMVVPVRLLAFFGFTGYLYLFKETGIFGSGPTAKAGITEPLKNSLTFTFGFFEIAIWFWIFTNLREERRQLAIRKMERLKAEQDSL
ncbi:hypothetical protein K470DRAFT_223716 [Piedraia hortae CBS 480.64]|uniref:Increased loss of mitochondrial DNA protein 1 n=1 Tax=Piedraia hortae CBS 480.64 TaxID=1314780 RepID=A0A6A7BR79_9PEZI|nr:hypothetical protein K470DRAFT_223716 [Piedraia hortae CBS 480.64]